MNLNSLSEVSMTGSSFSSLERHPGFVGESRDKSNLGREDGESAATVSLDNKSAELLSKEAERET